MEVRSAFRIRDALKFVFIVMVLLSLLQELSTQGYVGIVAILLGIVCA